MKEISYKKVAYLQDKVVHLLSAIKLLYNTLACLTNIDTTRLKLLLPVVHRLIINLP